MSELAGARGIDGWFAPKRVTELFEAFHLDSPGNVSRDLARLRKAGLITRRGAKPNWSVSPEGHERVKELVGEVDASDVLSGLTASMGAELGHALHTLIPPALAPVKWQEPIQRLLQEYDFDRNVFCMTRFPEDESDAEYLDPVSEIIPAAREVFDAHDLKLHVASDRQLDDDLFGNIAAHMWACRYGVALFEDRLGRGLNDNMIIEVGSMVITGRRCALMRDVTIDKMPTDFVGQIYKPVDFSDVDEICAELHGWAASDLGLGRCLSCPDDS